MSRRVSDFVRPVTVSIEPDAPLSEASGLMHDHGIRHLPVILAHSVVGMITASDLHVLESIMAVDSDTMLVGEVMTKDVVIVAPDTSLKRAASMMRDAGIGSLVVMSGDTLAGVFTSTDAVRALAALEPE